MTTILAVDCMGGDHGPRVTLTACRHFLDAALALHQEADNAQPLLVGEGLEKGQGRVEIRFHGELFRWASN